MFLLPWFQVVCGVHEDQVDGDCGGKKSKDGRYYEADLMKGEAVRVLFFMTLNNGILESCVANDHVGEYKLVWLSCSAVARCRVLVCKPYGISCSLLEAQRSALYAAPMTKAGMKETRMKEARMTEARKD